MNEKERALIEAVYSKLWTTPNRLWMTGQLVNVEGCVCGLNKNIGADFFTAGGAGVSRSTGAAIRSIIG